MKTRTVVSVVLLAFLITLVACSLPAAGDPSHEPGIPTAPPGPPVSADMSTSCRAGPGPGYDSLGTLEPGGQAEAVGRSPQGDYLLVRLPAIPSTPCWVDAQYVTLVGDPGILPVSTPPATPSPIASPTPLPGPTLVPGGPIPGSGCPSPVPSGPTPLSCEGGVPPAGSGCPSPVPSGPTPLSCDGSYPPAGSGCPSPVPSGPTPVSCATLPPGWIPPGSGCPSPVPSGPTPASCPPTSVP